MIVTFHWRITKRYMTDSLTLANLFLTAFFYSGAFLSALFVAGARAIAVDPNTMTPEIQLQPKHEGAVPITQSYQYQPQPMYEGAVPIPQSYQYQPQPEPQTQYGHP